MFAPWPFFVYGTLQRGQCRETAWPHTPQHVVPAWTRGRLLDLGTYPGLMAGDHRVLGELWYFAPQELPATLRALDDVEGYQPGGESLYVRRTIECFTEDGQPHTAYAYLYAQVAHTGPHPEIMPGADGYCNWRAYAGNAKTMSHAHTNPPDTDAHDAGTSTPHSCFALQARFVFPVTGPPLRDAVVVVRGSTIDYVGPSRGNEPTTDLGNVAILPALVNAHTHLEFSSITQPLHAPRGDFTQWLRAVLQWRGGRDAADDQAHGAAIRDGLQQCLDHGTIGVGEIATSCDTSAANLPGPAHGTIYRECISLSDERTRLILQQLDDWQAHAWQAHGAGRAARWRPGISPHAPYTASVPLIQAIVERSRHWGWPIAMHLAETPDERELLASHSGPLWELLRERDVWNPTAIPRGIDLTDYLRMLLRAHRVAIIHGNCLGSDDWRLLADYASHMALVHCPRTHAHFQRPTFPLSDVLRAGVRVALGTDSRASNPDLSMWRELQFARQRYADVPSAALLEMATVHAAFAVGLAPHLGTLTADAAANLIVVQLPDREADDPYELILDGDSSLSRCMYDGRWHVKGHGTGAVTHTFGMG